MHYVPQFVLRRFRPGSNVAAPVWYANKEQGTISRRSVKNIFAEDDGELLLKEPLSVKREGRSAVLDKRPVFTEVARDDIRRLDSMWAQAITFLVKHTPGPRTNILATAQHSGVVPVLTKPPSYDRCCNLAKAYCVQQRFRSPHAVDEAYPSLFSEQEDVSLRMFIRRQTGEDLEPSEEVRQLWRQQNRHQISTGILADESGLFALANTEACLDIYIAGDGERFILGDMGGAPVAHGDESWWIFPVDPKVAFALAGHDWAQGGTAKLANVRRLPRDDLTIELINP